MNKLIVVASPNSNSFSNQIKDRIKEELESAGHRVKVMDLYSREYRQDFLEFENIRDFRPDEQTLKIQKMISQADEIIFLAPVWWMNIPAILKNFIDRNFTPWFAYKYVKWKSMPEKLLTGKTAKVMLTCDAPLFANYLMLMPHKMSFGVWSLAFCWIKVKKFKIFSSMRKRDEAERAKTLEEASTIALK